MSKANRFAFLHMSNTFLNILTVANKAVFCITRSTWSGIPSFSIHLSNPLVTLPRVHITTGTTSIILSSHNLPIFLFKSWYFSTFSLSFPPTLHQRVQQCRWLSPFAFFLSITIMLGLLASITLSHWTLISHKTFTSSFSITPSGVVHTTFPYSPTHSSFKNPGELSLLHCHFVSYIPSELISHIHILSVASDAFTFFPHNLHRGLSLVLSM